MSRRWRARMAPSRRDLSPCSQALLDTRLRHLYFSRSVLHIIGGPGQFTFASCPLCSDFYNTKLTYIKENSAQNGQEIVGPPRSGLLPCQGDRGILSPSPRGVDSYLHK